jgi:hypothetical protein
MTDYFKVLDHDGSAYHGGRGKWRKGRWRSVRGELIPCERGLHLCTIEQLPPWLGPTIWRAEVHPDSEIIEADDKVVVRKARVVERLPWDGRTARLFAADCAEHVLHLFETEFPEDDRPRRAIEAARAYANGEIGEEELRAARAAARAALAARPGTVTLNDIAVDAAVRAARYAAEDAAEAWYAAWAAAEDAAEAWAAARDAARYAAEDAAAARDAARYAAEDAAEARVAAWDAAIADERSWQAQRLAHHLGVAEAAC